MAQRPAYSTHTILREVYDTSNSAIRILFESGGGGSAYSSHTIARAVYDDENGAIRVVNVGGGGGTGDVVGPSSATDNAIALFDGTTGKVIKDSGTLISDLAAASHTHTAADVTDFDTEVSNNADVAANTSHRGNTSNPHSTSVGNLGSGTLAELNSAVTDATLDDASNPRTPKSHASTHEYGGSDKIDVTGLSGLLADPQTPADHTHPASDITDFDDEVSNNSDVAANTTHRTTTSGNPHQVKATEISDFDTEVSNNSDVSANTTHRNTTTGNPHQVKATEISDFDTEVSNNSDVSANTSNRHSHPKFFGKLNRDMAINGSWQLVNLNVITNSGFSYSSGEITISEAGYYTIRGEVTNDNTYNNTKIYCKFMKAASGGLFADLSNSERGSHTSNAGRNFIATTVGPIQLAAGDRLKFYVKTDNYNSGKDWLGAQTVVSITGEVDE